MEKNLGTADMLVRSVFAGIVLILFLFEVIGGPLAAALLALAVALLLTVLFRFCPLYRTFGLNSSDSHEKRRTLRDRVWWFLAIAAIITMVHHLVLRPWFMNWGAPEHIQSVALPGDRFTTDKGYTRAVLIQATPEEIWPWIVQLGQDRGGMYSFSWLENIFWADIHNVYELKEDLQVPRQQGDTIWLANPDHYKGQGHQVLALVIPRKAFVMVGGKDYQRIQSGGNARGSWSIYLYEENKNFTWLIARSSGGDYPVANRIIRYFTFEVPHFIMEKKMLTTIKRLAEQ